MASSRTMRRLFVVTAAVAVLIGAQGCGYAKNMRDDVMDLVDLSVGVNLPRVGANATPFRPPVGVYVEATDFLHFGAISRAGANLEWDGRGVGVLGDIRKKIGFGPWHSVTIKQVPWATNDYKRTGNKLDGWRGRMKAMGTEGAPAMQMVFTGEKSPYFYKGWQSAAHFSAEASLHEPLITRIGVYVRVGLDPYQATDLLLSAILLDVWGDNAFKLWSGKPKYGVPEA